MGTDQEVRERFTRLVEAIERGRGDAGSLAPRIDELVEAGRALSDACEVLEARLEAREDQVRAQRAMLEAISCPLLQVGVDVLCAPVVGGLDAGRAAQFSEKLLFGAAARGVRAAVVDVTGAVVDDASTMAILAQALRGLSLLGVRGVLSGVRPDMAQLLMELPDVLSSVTCYANLATALKKLGGGDPQGGGRA